MTQELTDEQIDEIQNAAYSELRKTGFNGGMGGQQWDRASARAIEAALTAQAPLRMSDEDTLTNIIAWVDSRIEAEVTHRPDVNVHKRTLSNTWDQVRSHLVSLKSEPVPVIGERQAGQAPYAWCVASTNSADWCFSATQDGVQSNALLMDGDCIKTDPFPLYTAGPAQPEWDEPLVRALSASIALDVAKNASTAPQLCFPDIYLSLKQALLPVTQEVQS